MYTIPTPDIAIPFVAHSLSYLAEKAGVPTRFSGLTAVVFAIGAAFVFVPNSLDDIPGTLGMGLIGGLLSVGFTYLDNNLPPNLAPVPTAPTVIEPTVESPVTETPKA